MQELEGASAVYRVRAVEELEFHAVTQAQLVVVPANLAEFPRHSFGWLAAVAMPGLHHDRVQRLLDGQRGRARQNRF